MKEIHVEAHLPVLALTLNCVLVVFYHERKIKLEVTELIDLFLDTNF